MKKLTVFIGRFSPFHLGHEDVLLRALKSSEVVLLLIGSSFSARNIKNPFTYSERRDMILNWYSQNTVGTLEIKPLQDHPYNNQQWIKEVQDLVFETKTTFNIDKNAEVYLTGSDKDSSTWYLNTFGNFFIKDFLINPIESHTLSATSVREYYFGNGNISNKLPKATWDFLHEFRKTELFENLCNEYNFVKKYKESWSTAPFPPTFVCVDACVVQSGHVLVVVRDAQPGKGLWALPGGFVDQNETLKDAAVRELREETSIELAPAQLYGSISDKETFDHPDRSLRGRTITTCFTFSLKDGANLPKIKPQAGEVAKVMWVPISEALFFSDKWYEDHNAILETMISRIKS